MVEYFGNILPAFCKNKKAGGTNPGDVSAGILRSLTAMDAVAGLMKYTLPDYSPA